MDGDGGIRGRRRRRRRRVGEDPEPRPDTGDVTRLLRFDAGVETTETITHDFWEEVWILEGSMIDLGKRQTFTAGMYACRPPGMIHGPYRVPAGGCLTFEIRYRGRR
jgi:hypothetical protein